MFPENLLNDKGFDVTACERQVRKTTSSGALPLTVISSTKCTDDWDAGATGIAAKTEEVAERALLECQAKLLGLSTNAEQMLATESGHYIQDDQPDLVITAIVRLIKRVRRKNRL